MVTSVDTHRFDSILAEAKTNPGREYNLSRIEAGCGALGFGFEYHGVTTSTMDDAKKFGVLPTVILADFQENGRGRYGRVWKATPGESLLFTIVSKWGLQGDSPDPPLDSLYPLQFMGLVPCLAVEELVEDSPIRNRWPNDLTAKDPATGLWKKMGGILIEANLQGNRTIHPRRFGIGLNVHQVSADRDFPGTDYGAISLDEALGHEGPTREVLLLSMLRKWVILRDDIRMLGSPRKFAEYQELLDDRAMLIGQEVEISGLGKDRKHKVSGRVEAIPLGQGIMIETGTGTEEVVEFHRETVLQVKKKEV